MAVGDARVTTADLGAFPHATTGFFLLVSTAARALMEWAVGV